MGRHLCFLCGGALASIGDAENCWKARKTGAALLENNLNVIFLLRKLLQMPVIQLECQLKESGDNPESWISLCDQCIQLIRKGRELDEEIQKIERRLRSIKMQVISKIRTGGPGTTDDKQEGEKSYLGLGDSDGDFGSKIKIYAQNYQLNHVEDERDGPAMMEGDNLADYLESQGNDCTAAIVLVEKPPCEDDQDQIKVEQESPPMSPAPLESPDHFVDDNEDNPSYDPAKEPDENVGKADKGNCSCPDCGQKFNSPNSLGRHMKRIHKKQFQVNCPLCPKSFRLKRNVNRHLLGKHKDDPLAKKLEEETGLFLRKCSVVGCGVCFMKQADEDRHMKRIHDGKQSNEKRFKCQYCQRGFWDMGKCKRHEKIHEEKGTVRQIHRKPRSKNGGVNTEVAKDPSNNQFKCDNCPKTFKWARNWSDHLWNTHDKRDISCPGPECGQIFNDNLDEFRIHWKKSHKVNVILSKPGETFICEICGVEKTSQQKLYQHKYDVHKRNKKSTAKNADTQLSSSSSARVEGGGPFICEICGKGQRSQIGLWRHKRLVHKSEKAKRKKGENDKTKFLCNLCGKEFSRSNLNTHVRFVHDKQYSLSCHVCGLKFTNKSQMHMHLLASHREDPVARKLEEEEGLKFIKCGVVGCMAKFLKQDKLDKHVKTFHGGVPPRFQCKYCGRGFQYRNRVRTHELLHEARGREDFKCEICGKGFGTKEYLRYHLLKTHKLEKKCQDQIVQK